MIDAFTRSWNDGSGPFTRVRTADEILAKAVHKPRANSELGHDAGRGRRSARRLCCGERVGR